VNADGSDAATSLVKGTTNDYAVTAQLSGSSNLYWVTNDVTFSSDDAAVTIPSTTNDGSVTATAASVGSALLTAGAAGIVDTVTVTVTEEELDGIACTPDPICITVADKAQVHVIAHFTDNSTQLVTGEMVRDAYSVDDDAIADFLSQDPIGVITGMSESGTTTPASVTVTYGGFSDTCDVYVVNDISECGD
jgi:hypothetical protein